MAFKEIKDVRSEYAAKLREFADLVEQAPHQPVGAAIQIFWNQGEITRLCKAGDGFHPLMAAGLYTRMAAEFALGPKESEFSLPETPK